MENDKLNKKYAEKEREVEESKRLYEMEVGKLRTKETELREASAKLSVYQQIDSNTRLSSLVDDVEPELLKTKNMKIELDDMKRQVTILKNQNQSELSN